MQPFLLRDGARCDDCVGRAPLPGVVHRCYRDSLTQSGVAAAAQLTHRALGTWRRRVTTFVAVSQSLADTIRAGNVVPPEKLTVCHNALADDPGERAPAEDAGYALFAGRLSPEKGVADILAAAAKVPDLPIVIAGDGPARATLEANAPSHVQFVGHVEPARVRALLRGARVALAPSIGQEPFGMAVVEAAAVGVPTIASTNGAFPELIDDGATGVLVAPNQPDGLATALRRAGDRAAMHQLGRAARVEFATRFTPDAFVQRLLAVYAAAR
jgi:glycosyltransferase involved in cell wall biosynthesis